MPDVQGLVWHGTTTERTEEMVRFCRDVLNLGGGMVQEGTITRFELQNGDAFVVLPAPKAGDSSVYSQPAFGFLVPDVQASYDEMKSKGTQFLGPVHQGSSATWADAWAHFRAPDGYVYALVSRPRAYPAGRQRKFHELRLCCVADDLEQARQLGDALGLAVVDEWTHPGGEQGVLLAVCPASLEFVRRSAGNTAAQGQEKSEPRVELRIECDDVEAVSSALAHNVPAVQLSLFELPPEEREVRRAARALLPK